MQHQTLQDLPSWQHYQHQDLPFLTQFPQQQLQSPLLLQQQCLQQSQHREDLSDLSAEQSQLHRSQQEQLHPTSQLQPQHQENLVQQQEQQQPPQQPQPTWQVSQSGGQLQMSKQQIQQQSSENLSLHQLQQRQQSLLHQSTSQSSRGSPRHSVNFHAIISTVLPTLPRYMQLHVCGICHKFSRKEISHGEFLQIIRASVGDRRLVHAALHLQMKIKAGKKKLSARQKKPDVTGLSTEAPSKKQNISGHCPEQSIKQLNDVTTVSGVDLREEEVNLLAGPKEESHATEAIRRIAQKEENAMFLEKGPLHARLTEILAKAGLKNIGNDTERCLSLCVEERLRILLWQMIRLSKQRTDVNKEKCKIEVTSDMQSQMLVNKGLKNTCEKKETTEAKNLHEATKTESTVENVEETHPKPKKLRQEDNWQTNAANIAARAALGGDDMLSKWRLMAEQAQQNRDGASNDCSGKGGKNNLVETLKSESKSKRQEVPRQGVMTRGSSENDSINHSSLSERKPTRTLTIEDLIHCLESDPQMAKSSILHRLYPKDASERPDKPAKR